MSRWLADHQAQPRISNLELFDYKADIKPRLPVIDKMSVCYAGNLNKSGFIYEFGKRAGAVKLNVYGPNFDLHRINADNERVEYKGSYDADILHTIIEGAFGLVWDGDRLDTCSGSLGEYTRYNNPNKVSFYIAAGIPVIVWSDAAVAKIVEERNIGFSISSLEDLEERLTQINDQTYYAYLENIKAVQDKVVNGHYIKSAVNKILALKESNAGLSGG
jgi:glycosyltransferase involved in cell wall biosynthesis